MPSEVHIEVQEEKGKELDLWQSGGGQLAGELVQERGAYAKAWERWSWLVEKDAA